MITKEYRENRARFSTAELIKYRGNWVAFLSNGKQIVASAPTVEQLEEQLATKNTGDLSTVLEWVPGSDEDSLLGSGEVQ